ncbi:DNA-processing protein DprA, partial [Candidatus Binatus sp.]|uniref:DNA-processing protein DprA n=1 Tax=Candidatus Binatus sp. TaxID=2811406 RepID=UPI003CB9F870
GVTVVSGLARGIDGDAHQGALDAHGKTLAVLGCGVDVIYPPEHRNLAEAIIAGGGGLISELPIGMQPLAENFPTRNRILSGLCLGVVIVEAAEKSGSLITARMALEQDRQVFAVPGSPLSGKTRGSNRLLKEGAKLVECVEDVIEELAPQMIGGGRPRMAERIPVAPSEKVPTPPTSNTSARPEVVWVTQSPEDANSLEGPVDSTTTILNNLKESDKLHVDSIIESSGLNAQTVLRLLLELELEGRVTQHPGKLFSLA